MKYFSIQSDGGTDSGNTKEELCFYTVIDPCLGGKVCIKNTLFFCYTA